MPADKRQREGHEAPARAHRLRVAPVEDAGGPLVDVDGRRVPLVSGGGERTGTVDDDAERASLDTSAYFESARR